MKPRAAIFACLPLAVLAIGAASCERRADLPAFAGSRPLFTPETFFRGRAHSWGVIESSQGAPSRHLAVESAGAPMSDGAFRLDQTVRIDGGSRRRTWIIRRLGEHRYTAALTDASGPVRAEAYGNLFHLRYGLKGMPGAVMEQWIYLQPDGGAALNEAVVRVLGVTVARIAEVIIRDGPPVGGGRAN